MKLAWLMMVALTAMGIGEQVNAAAAITISSPSFAAGKPMPGKHSLNGGNLSPELRIENIPGGARGLVLIVDDPDAPAGLWTHWLVWNLPASMTKITEGALPSGAVEGKNSFGHVGYDGPAPPSGTHRYFFHIYALDEPLSLPPGSERSQLLGAMSGHILGSGQFFGIYSAGQ